MIEPFSSEDPVQLHWPCVTNHSLIVTICCLWLNVHRQGTVKHLHLICGRCFRLKSCVKNCYRNSFFFLSFFQKALSSITHPTHCSKAVWILSIEHEKEKLCLTGLISFPHAFPITFNRDQSIQVSKNSHHKIVHVSFWSIWFFCVTKFR